MKNTTNDRALRNRGTLLFDSRFGTARRVVTAEGRVGYTADQRVFQRLDQKRRQAQAAARG